MCHDVRTQRGRESEISFSFVTKAQNALLARHPAVQFLPAWLRAGLGDTFVLGFVTIAARWALGTFPSCSTPPCAFKHKRKRVAYNPVIAGILLFLSAGGRGAHPCKLQIILAPRTWTLGDLGPSMKDTCKIFGSFDPLLSAKQHNLPY